MYFTANVIDDSSLSRNHRTIVVASFVILLAIYLATGTYDARQTTDTRASAVAAWSLGERGTFFLPDETQDVPWERPARDGRTAIARFPGATIWAAPFYALWPGVPNEIESAEDVPYGPAGVAAAIAAALAVSILTSVIIRDHDERTAVLVAIAVGLGSTVWSVAADALWTHGPALVGVSLILYGVRSERPSLATLGTLFAVLSRPPLVVAALVMAVWAASTHRRTTLLSIALGGGLAVMILMAVNYLVFTDPLPTSGYETGPLTTMPDPRDVGVRIVGSLVSPTRGVLVTSPWLFVLLPVAAAAWRDSESWVQASCAGGIIYAVVQLALYSYTGGQGYFGGRFLIESLVLATPLLASAWRAGKVDDRLFRWVAAGALTISVLGNLAGTTLLDPDRGKEPFDHFRERWVSSHRSAVGEGDGFVLGSSSGGATAGRRGSTTA